MDDNNSDSFYEQWNCEGFNYSRLVAEYLNIPRPAPIWPCSSVGRDTMICSGGRGFKNHRGKRLFLFLPWAHSRAIARKA